ncbi:MAG: hypothetical protein A2283_01830 [Lentisphaerae bacterium RIFOXYA12_FULL_48_11]|nr:MAG: hypothetical protein A2283_01830 [Lentisphaerae bacterium RIFOXYA12_FULL_48_11]
MLEIVKTIGILQPSYLPWLGCFEQVHKADVFVFYDDVQYEKNSWRNRNQIKTAQGVQWLTVPVLTANLGSQLIKDVRIDTGSSWQRKHKNALTLSYSKAKFFKTYADEFFGLLEKDWKFLCELDIALTLWLCSKLGVEVEAVRSSELGIAGDRIERLIGIIRHFGGNVFYEGAAGRNYIDPAVFRKEGISVRFQDYRHPSYEQLYGEFVPYLTVLDLLFNCGDRSLEILISGHHD